MKKDHYALKAAMAMLTSLMLCGFIPMSYASPLHAYASNMSAEPQDFNSSSGSTIISFYLSGISNGSSGRLDIYDQGGAIIRTLNKTALKIGPNNVTWNGRDKKGNPVKEGRYTAVFTISGQSAGSGPDIANGSPAYDMMLVDNTSPVTSASLYGVQGNEGWYLSDTVVNLSVDDGLSGVNLTRYQVDSGGWNDYSGNFTVGDGTHTLDYFSIDRAGNVEQKNIIEINVDAVSPEVSSISPGEGESPDANAVISATFSKPMDAGSINGSTFILEDSGGQPVTSSISYNGSVATLAPETSLTPGASYTVVITDLICDIHGKSLEAGVNRTFVVADPEPYPAVISTDPADGLENVPLTSAIAIFFDRPMMPESINEDTFIVTTEYGDQIDGVVSYGTCAVFTPAVAFFPETGYVTMVTTGARSADGDALKDNYTWTFRTQALNIDTGDGQAEYQSDDNSTDVQSDADNISDDSQDAIIQDDNDTTSNDTVLAPDQIDDSQTSAGIFDGFSTVGGITNRLAPTHITAVQMPRKSLMETIAVISAVLLRRMLLKI